MIDYPKVYPNAYAKVYYMSGENLADVDDPYDWLYDVYPEPGKAPIILGARKTEEEAKEAAEKAVTLLKEGKL